MKRKSFYILSFILISLTVIIASIRYFNQQSIVENKIIYLLPQNPTTLIQFKNPDELYNKYFTQNNLFRKLSFPQKQELFNIFKKTDSLYRIAVAKSIQFQDYSFIFAVYPNHHWILAFAVYQTKDIKAVKQILSEQQLYYIETDGNFFISDNHINLKSPDTKDFSHLQEWLNIFSKTPVPLSVYFNKDTTELAFQINFQGNEIDLNGFVFYKNIKKYDGYPKMFFSFNDVNKIHIADLQLKKHSSENEYIGEFYSILLNKYLEKEISLNNLVILPVSDSESFDEIIKTFSDSVIQNNDITIYKIKHQYLSEFNELYPMQSDSVLFIAITENNIAFSNVSDAFVKYKNILYGDFSKSSFYLNMNKEVNPDIIEKSDISRYIPLNLRWSSDTALYDVYAEIFSSLKKNYFSFAYKIKQNAINKEYLWAYSHTLNINKIAGVFDDHKTKTYFILIQDTLNQLIALNSNAEYLWIYKLESSVKSDIFNVDILKNNKHQILFNTSKKIYLLDRNGKDVGNFPIKFVSDITNPMNVFDYENKRNYRLWFSTKNFYTYNYTPDGKIAEQFRPYYFNEHITHSPFYTKIGLSDYIILISEKGTILSISRKGDGRFLLKNKLPVNTIDYYFDVSNTLQNSYLYYCTNEGLYRISLSDEVKTIFKFKEKIKDVKFVKNNFNQTFIAVLLSNQLKLFTLKSEEIQSIDTDTSYSEIKPIYSASDIYFVLKNAEVYSVVRYNIDKKLEYIIKNIQSNTEPYICPLFNDNQDYLIYVQKNKLMIKKLFF